MAKGRKHKLKADDYVRAIEEANGLLSVAARRLGVSRRTMYDARDRYVSVKEAIEEARERTIDLAEGKLFGKVNEGDVTAIIFLLKCLGKGRGYVDRLQVQHSGKLDMSWVASLSDEELEELAAEHGLT